MRDLRGKNVVVTGTIGDESRLTASAKLRDAGATVQSAIGPTTDLLVTGDKVGKRKIEEAQRRGIEMVPWLDLFRFGSDGEPMFEAIAEVPVAVIDGDGVRPGVLTSDDRGDVIKMDPRDVGPMLCKSAPDLPVGPGWLYEVKWDGLRCIARVHDSHVQSSTGGFVTMRSRSGKSDYAEQFPQIAAQLRQLGTDVVLDGELVVLDGQSARSYVVWDVIEMNDVDLRTMTLETRKRILAELAIVGFGDRLVLQPVFDEPGPLWQEVVERGLEGVVAKHRDSSYVEGSRQGWVKTKLRNAQEFVVIGYVPGKGALTGLAGGVVLAVHEDGRWRYVGRAGSGPTDYDRRILSGHLESLAIAGSLMPQRIDPAGATRAELREVIWVKPELVVEVQFQKWTEDRRLVHPSLKQIRYDKEPTDVVFES